LQLIPMQLNDDTIGGGRISVNNGGIVDGMSGGDVAEVANDRSSLGVESSDSYRSGSSGGGGWGRRDNIPLVVSGAMPPFPPSRLMADETIRREGCDHQTNHGPKRKRALTEEAHGHGANKVLAGELDEAGEKERRWLRTTEEATPAPAGSLARKPPSGDPEQPWAISSTMEALHRKVSLSLTRPHMHDLGHA
jgi:hypothetical protein